MSIDTRWTTAIKEPEEESSASVKLEEMFTSPVPPEPDWEQVWTLLTEQRQLGLGEDLATEAWLPRPKEGAPAAPEAPRYPAAGRTMTGDIKKFVKHQIEQEKARREGREEALPGPRRAIVRYDTRHANYFQLMGEARKKCKNALIDPYTDIFSEFSTVGSVKTEWERPKTRSYAYAAEANLKIGRQQIVNSALRAAESSFRRALRADAHDAEAWWHYGIVKLLRRKNKAAVEALETACNYRPGDSLNRITLGIAHYHNRDYASAEDCFRYERSPEGRGVGARSFYICALRMQGKWDAARMEIQALAQHPLPAWKEMAAQCARCVDRGEGLVVEKKPVNKYWTLAKIAGAVAFPAYLIFANLDEIARAAESIKKFRWESTIVPVVFLLLALASHFRSALKPKELPKSPFGDGQEDLPCWQTRAWMRPHRLDVFGQPMEIPRR